MEATKKDLEYYRKNAEEDYLTTPISVLRYISEMEAALRQPLVISSVCTCRNAEIEKDSLFPVYCHNCNAYVQTDL